MTEIIDKLKDMHPAVAVTLVICGSAIIGIAIYSYFKWLSRL